MIVFNHIDSPPHTGGQTHCLACFYESYNIFFQLLVITKSPGILNRIEVG
jgi:hypothetical protein